MCPTSGSSILQGLWKQISGSNEPGRVQEAFGVLDVDGDGQIKSSDLTHFFQSCVGTPISEEEVQMMIGMADLDGDGGVDLQEFERLMREETAGKVMGEGQTELLREMFRNLDVNQDGVLCAEDLGAAMDLFGQPICEEEELHAMLAAAAPPPPPHGAYVKEKYASASSHGAYVKEKYASASGSSTKSPTIDFQSFCRFMTQSSHP